MYGARCCLKACPTPPQLPYSAPTPPLFITTTAVHTPPHTARARGRAHVSVSPNARSSMSSSSSVASGSLL